MPRLLHAAWLALVVTCLGTALSPGQPPLVQEREKTAEEKEAEKKAAELKAKKEAERQAERAERAKKIQMEIVLPESEVSLRQANSSRFRFIIKITNPTDVPTVLAPFYTLKILDADGEPLRLTRRIDRWGLDKSEECRLEEIEFDLVPPQKSREISCHIREFRFDPNALIGYRFPAAGEYTLVVTHDFKASSFVARCKKPQCRYHDHEDKPWNRALELKRTMTAKLTVTE